MTAILEVRNAQPTSYTKTTETTSVLGLRFEGAQAPVTLGTFTLRRPDGSDVLVAPVVVVAGDITLSVDGWIDNAAPADVSYIKVHQFEIGRNQI